MDLRPVDVPLPPEIAAPNVVTLQLEESVSNQVLVSAIISATHVFLQIPTHESFNALPQLDAEMLGSYGRCAAPLLPEPLELGTICAAPHEMGWYRVQLIEVRRSEWGWHPFDFLPPALYLYFLLLCTSSF